MYKISGHRFIGLTLTVIQNVRILILGLLLGDTHDYKQFLYKMCPMSQIFYIGIYNLYLNRYENVCLSVYSRFSRPFGI